MPISSSRARSRPGSMQVARSSVLRVGSDHQPVREFSVTLFPDGTFRYDYAGTNSPGGAIAFVGLSTGNGGIDDVALHKGNSRSPALQINVPSRRVFMFCLGARLRSASYLARTYALSIMPASRPWQRNTSLSMTAAT